MDTYELKLTSLQNKMFQLLCIKAGESMNQREIALTLGVSPTAVSKALKGLGILAKVEKSARMNLTAIQLNRDALLVIGLKRAENLKQIYNSGLAECLEEWFPGSTIVLFGSYSMGEDTIKSDIDIAVIGAKEKIVDLSRFEKLLGRKIIINTYKDIKKMDKNLKQNILNGITIHGALEI